MRWRSRLQRFGAPPPRSCLASRRKQRAPFSVRMRCCPACRSIRCADACCTGSGSCFVCAQSMPKRWPWRSKPSPSRPQRTIRPCAGGMHRARPGGPAAGTLARRPRMDRARARSRGAGGLRAGRDLRVRSAGDAAGAARHPAPSLRPGRAGARAPAARAHARAPAATADGADGRDLVRRAVRGAARQPAASCSACGGDEGARRQVRIREWPVWEPLVSGVGGQPHGTAAGGLPQHSRGV